MAIDWDFIGELEGFRLKGYVPNPETSNSGVTVASGVDLGQVTQAELATFPAALQPLLQPYIGLKGQEAVAALEATPLALSVDQCEELDALVEDTETAPMRAKYLHDAGVDFRTLPKVPQTVIASVTFQYGSTWVRCPKFWGFAVKRDWHGMSSDLKNFGDSYGPRRLREAQYLDRWLNSTALVS
jgi:hypothetical protein